MNKASGRPLAIFAAVFAALAARLFAGHYSWTTTGPEPGQVFQILSYASDPNRLYVVDSYFGGYLFRSDDRGQSWCYLDALVPGSVIADPSNPDVLYSPSYPSVVKTTDGGASWKPASAGLPSGYESALVLAPSQPSRLYVYVGPGGNAPATLYRSDDGAATWSAVEGDDPPTNWSLTVDAFDADTLYGVDGPSVRTSTDGGSTWGPPATGLPGYPQWIFSDPRVPGRIWAATDGSGPYLSVDGGASFAPSNAGMLTQQVRSMAFDPLDPQTLYAASTSSSVPEFSGGVFVSHDSGEMWTPVDLGFGGPHGATSVAVAQAGPPQVYAGASQGLRGGFFKSPNGSSWARSEKGLSGFTSAAVAPHPGLPNAAFAFSGPRFFGTLDAGATWSPLATPGLFVNFLLFDPTTVAVLYAQYGGYGEGIFHAGVYKSTNGGGTWADSSDGLPANYGYHLAVAASDPSTLLASTEGGTFKTTNAGDSWESVLSGYGRAVAIDPADADIMYASRPYGNGVPPFLRSDDGGNTWEEPSGWPTYGSPFDIKIPADDPTVVYALFSTAIYKSVDRGLSFAPASNGLPGSEGWTYYRIAFDPAATQTLYVASGLGGAVYRSTDGAASWRPIGKGIPTLTNLDFGVSTTGRDLYAGTVAGVFQYHRGFTDVSDTDPYWTPIDAAALNGVTSGCGGGAFCPTADNTRAQIAPMLLRAKETALYVPPAATGTVFSDVPANSFAAAWIEELAHRGIAAGCGSGDYCPSSPMTRAALAVMLLKAKHGSDYEPRPATGTVFLDVPVDAFAAAWIEELAAEGITAGCGGGYFCPDGIVVRSQAAALIVKAFVLS